MFNVSAQPVKGFILNPLNTATFNQGTRQHNTARQGLRVFDKSLKFGQFFCYLFTKWQPSPLLGIAWMKVFSCACAR